MVLPAQPNHVAVRQMRINTLTGLLTVALSSTFVKFTLSEAANHHSLHLSLDGHCWNFERLLSNIWRWRRKAIYPVLGRVAIILIFRAAGDMDVPSYVRLALRSRPRQVLGLSRPRQYHGLVWIRRGGRHPSGKKVLLLPHRNGAIL